MWLISTAVDECENFVGTNSRTCIIFRHKLQVSFHGNIVQLTALGVKDKHISLTRFKVVVPAHDEDLRCVEWTCDQVFDRGEFLNVSGNVDELPRLLLLLAHRLNYSQFFERLQLAAAVSEATKDIQVASQEAIAARVPGHSHGRNALPGHLSIQI